MAQVAIRGSTIVGLTLLLAINHQQRVPRYTLRTRPFLAHPTVLNRAVSRAFSEILRQDKPLVALPAIPIDNMIAAFNRRYLTQTRRFIDCKPVITIVTVLVVVKALAAIGHATGLAGLDAGKGFVVDVFAGLAFVAGELLDADLTVGD
jgi:hypothetical protein